MSTSATNGKNNSSSKINGNSSSKNGNNSNPDVMKVTARNLEPVFKAVAAKGLISDRTPSLDLFDLVRTLRIRTIYIYSTASTSTLFFSS